MSTLIPIIAVITNYADMDRVEEEENPDDKGTGVVDVE